MHCEIRSILLGVFRVLVLVVEVVLCLFLLFFFDSLSFFVIVLLVLLLVVNVVIVNTMSRQALEHHSKHFIQSIFSCRLYILAPRHNSGIVTRATRSLPHANVWYLTFDLCDNGIMKTYSLHLAKSNTFTTFEVSYTISFFSSWCFNTAMERSSYARSSCWNTRKWCSIL